MENMTELEMIACLECDLDAALAKIKLLESVIDEYQSPVYE